MVQYDSWPQYCWCDGCRYFTASLIMARVPRHGVCAILVVYRSSFLAEIFYIVIKCHNDRGKTRKIA